MHNAEQVLKKTSSFPLNASTSDLVAVLAITALETVIITALVKNYSVELTGETTESGFKGSLKLNLNKEEEKNHE